MTGQGWILIFVCAICTATSNLLLRKGIEMGGGFEFRWETGLRLGAQPVFVLGVLLYGIAALVWFRIVATETLSTAYPILVSITFALVSIGAYGIYQESVTPYKLLGMGFIVGGIALVTKGA
jgi:multidrug transporter EmrE-like cation transporter